MTEFTAWPKIARFRRDIVITEKIDGTNCAVVIEPGHPSEYQDGYVAGVYVDDTFYKVAVQSRKRIIPSGETHFGFPEWANENAQALVETLGSGVHFGEWWGKKIGRAYGKTDRTFSLFNTSRWEWMESYTGSGVPGLTVVPILYKGAINDLCIDMALGDLEQYGSMAAPGFMRPEGIVIYHTAADVMFKITLENDDVPKGIK